MQERAEHIAEWVRITGRRFARIDRSETQRLSQDESACRCG